MPDQFGGIEVDGTDQFGGIAVEDVPSQNRTAQPPSPLLRSIAQVGAQAVPSMNRFLGDMFGVPGAVTELGIPKLQDLGSRLMNEAGAEMEDLPVEADRALVGESVPEIARQWETIKHMKANGMYVDPATIRRVGMAYANAASAARQLTPSEQGTVGQPIISAEEINKTPLAVQNLLPQGGWPGALRNVISQFESGLTTPLNIAAAPFIEAKPIQAMFALETTKQGQEALVKAAEARTADEQRSALVGAAGSGLLSVLLGRGLSGYTRQPPILPKAPPPPKQLTGGFSMPETQGGPGPTLAEILGPGVKMPEKRARSAPPQVVQPQIQIVLRSGQEAIDIPRAPKVQPSTTRPEGGQSSLPTIEQIMQQNGVDRARAEQMRRDMENIVFSQGALQAPAPTTPLQQPYTPLTEQATVTPKRPFTQTKVASDVPPGQAPPQTGPGQSALPSVYPQPEPTELRTAAEIQEARIEQRQRELAAKQAQEAAETTSAARTEAARTASLREFDERTARETDESIIARSQEGPARQQLFAERAAARERLAQQPTTQPPQSLPPQQPIPFTAPSTSPVTPRPTLPRRAKGVARTQINTEQPALSRILSVVEQQHKTEEKAAPATLSTVFGNMTRWLRENGRKIDEPTIWQDYFAESSDETSKYFVPPTSRGQYLNSVKQAYRRLQRAGNEEAKLLADSERIGSIKKGPKTQEARPLSKEERGKLLTLTQQQATSGGPIGKRNYAYVSFLVDTYTRAGGVAELRMQDIDWQNNRVTLYGGSTEANTINVHPQTLARIRDYLEADGRMNQGPYELVFRADRGGPFDVDAQNHLIVGRSKGYKGLAADAGIPKFSSHSFRKSGEIPEEDVTEGALLSKSLRMGHKSPTTTTEHYLKLQQAAGEGLSEVDPTLTKGQTSDTQNQGRVQSGQPQGQSTQPNVPQQVGGTEAPPASGVFQAPQVEPPTGGGTKFFSGVPLPDDFGRYNDIQSQIKKLLIGIRSGTANADDAYQQIHALQTESEAIKNRNQGMPPRPDEVRLYSGVPIPDFGKAARGVKDYAERLLSVAGGVGGRDTIDPNFATKTLAERQASLKNVPKTVYEATPPQARQIGKTAKEVGYVNDLKRRLSNEVDKVMFNARKLDRLIMPIDALLDIMEKGHGKYTGWLFQNVRWPLDVRYQRELTRRDSVIAPVLNLMRKYKLDDEATGQRIGVYAHMQQEGGHQRLLEGGIKENEIQDIMSSMKPEELEIYREMRKHMDETLPDVVRIAKKLYDRDVKVVRNYFPWQRAWEVYERPPTELVGPEQGGEAGPDIASWRELEQDYHLTQSTDTEQGFTIERKPNQTSPIKLDAFDIYNRHMRDVAHFIEMQEALHDAGKLVRSKDFQAKFGRASQDMVMDWLNSVATQGRSTKRIMWLDNLRHRSTTGVIGLRLASQVVHLSNIPLAMQRAGVGKWFRGATDAVLSKEGQEFLREHFLETEERGGGEVDIQEAKYPRLAFALQKGIDRLNAQAVTLGVYFKELAAKGVRPEDFYKEPFDEVAGAKARVAARRAVASPLSKDIPLAITRGGSLSRLMLQFQNTFLDQWSNIRHDMMGTGLYAAVKAAAGHDASKEAIYAASMTVAVLTMLAADTAIKQGILSGSKAAVGYNERKPKSYWDRFEHEALRRIPGVSQAMALWQYDETGIPAFDVLATVGKRVRDVVQNPDSRSTPLNVIAAAQAAMEFGVPGTRGVPGASQGGELLSNYIKGRMQRRTERDINRVGGEMFPGRQSYTVPERAVIGQRLREEEGTQTIKQREAEEVGAAKAQAARRKDVLAGLPTDDQKWINANRLIPEGYRNTIEFNGRAIRLTQAEQEYHQQVITEELQRVIETIKGRADFDRFPDTLKQRFWSKLQSEAHKRAERRTLQFIQSGSKIEPDKKKAFSIFSPE